jgi:2-amino-4-hydroxy-6-hydroxymethyldihydropteridine diphosphokinase
MRSANQQQDGQTPGRHRYAIGLGSNRPLARGLYPRAILAAAMVALDRPPLRLAACTPIIASRPIGPSSRTYANAAALIDTALGPLAMLDRLQAIERAFRRRRQRRWGARTLDLDILLWSGGRVSSRRLTVPHPALPARPFVLVPLRMVAPLWRDPASGRSVAQLAASLLRPRPARPKPVDRTGRAF